LNSGNVETSSVIAEPSLGAAESSSRADEPGSRADDVTELVPDGDKFAAAVI